MLQLALYSTKRKKNNKVKKNVFYFLYDDDISIIFFESMYSCIHFLYNYTLSIYFLFGNIYATFLLLCITWFHSPTNI